ncbi:uncharacterized protein LOC125724056 [Brienomyrus brachyistius]|uniref:uncharacterized protein LOC125724056 n=1 Tax=Brienomyrus brachyistius TaxID=42636 RepID=UPI0020B29A7A|nr:uncharacterized protein LOC125724056 [Brienomyrus brachyistius]
MASASLARRKSLSTPQALALLQEMDAADSDGGELSFARQLADASSEESEMEMEEKPDMPPRKMRRGTRKPCPSQTAKDGTVWVEEDIGSRTPSASARPTESAKRKITSVLQSFLCLLDVGMLQTITECTVHQARRTEPDWKLAINELMAFISILFVRAIMSPIGAITDCWSENFLVPVIKETMSRGRFLTIMQHLRFDDKDTRAKRVKTDRFSAISDIWTRFTKNCAESFTPGEHVFIHEQLFPTKVRCPFTQYIASHPDKFGIKFWMATDLETKYICNVSPYLGKDPSRQKGDRLAESVVMSLMEPFLDDGRNVTTDSFFTSLSLSDRLLQRNTTLLGTVNKVRREFPPSSRMYSVRAATRRWPVAVFYNMLDLAAANAYVLYKACTGWKGKRRLFLSLLAKELRCRFMQQKAMETAGFAVAVTGLVQTTQCQVQESCNRNRSRFACVKCHKFTCGKCRDDSHWVCKRCVGE